MNRNYNEACFNKGIQGYVDSSGIEFVGGMKVIFFLPFSP